jgi:hypothetical protein
VSDNPGALYHSMHSYLAGSAVDGVKVDCQVRSDWVSRVRCSLRHVCVVIG